VVLLLWTKQVALKKDPHASITTYAGLAGHIFGTPGFVSVQIIVVFLEIAFCAGFVIVICATMRQDYGLDAHVTALALSLPLVLLSWIKWMKDLWFIAFLGLFVYLFGVIGVVVFDGLAYRETITVEVVNWDHILSFVGSTVYALEGINVVIPVEQSMEKTEDAVAGRMSHAE
jgi:hypothetical protein